MLEIHVVSVRVVSKMEDTLIQTKAWTLGVTMSEENSD